MLPQFDPGLFPNLWWSQTHLLYVSSRIVAWSSDLILACWLWLTCFYTPLDPLVWTNSDMSYDWGGSHVAGIFLFLLIPNEEVFHKSIINLFSGEFNLSMGLPILTTSSWWIDLREWQSETTNSKLEGEDVSLQHGKNNHGTYYFTKSSSFMIGIYLIVSQCADNPKFLIRG